MGDRDKKDLASGHGTGEASPPEGIGIPSVVKAQMGRLLVEGYMGEVRLNASLGYEVEPGLGAPEVYERPGWRMMYAPEGVGGVALEVASGEGEAVVFGGREAPAESGLEVEVVMPRRAYLRTELVSPRGEEGVVDWGLGVSEGERLFVVFHWVVGSGG